MPLSLASSSIFKKAVMAVTGLALLGFVIAHLLGNLQIFCGPEVLNAYAEKLRKLGPLLWAMRAGLLVFFAAHVITAVQLSLENRRARPIPYSRTATIETTIAARTMMLSGLLILAYVIYHLLHFTFHTVHHELLPGHHGEHLDVYKMVVASFQHPAISAAYIVAMIVLFFHLSHGISSVPQTLGLNNEKWIPRFKRAGWILALLISLGYIAIPVAVLGGWVS